MMMIPYSSEARRRWMMNWYITLMESYYGDGDGGGGDTRKFLSFTDEEFSV